MQTNANAKELDRMRAINAELVEALEGALDGLEYATKHLDNLTINGHRVLRQRREDTRAALAKAKL